MTPIHKCHSTSKFSVKKRSEKNSFGPHENGSSIILTLVLLLAILLVGTSMANIAIVDTKSVHNQHDRLIALEAAESALIDAELDIENSHVNNSRSQLFSRHSAKGFTNGCGKGEANIYQGLCLNNDAATEPIWLSSNIANGNTNSPSVQFGRFTGQTMPSGTGPLPNQLPRYIIELMPDNAPGNSADTTYIYRITAIGFGSNSNTQVVVQSFYRKAHL
ncbi:type IV pilus assembly protein PilX [Oxalobacteraceae bacterium GrIS 1.18]